MDSMTWRDPLARRDLQVPPGRQEFLVLGDPYGAATFHVNPSGCALARAHAATARDAPAARTYHPVGSLLEAQDRWHEGLALCRSPACLAFFVSGVRADAPLWNSRDGSPYNHVGGTLQKVYRGEGRSMIKVKPCFGPDGEWCTVFVSQAPFRPEQGPLGKTSIGHAELVVGRITFEPWTDESSGQVYAAATITPLPVQPPPEEIEAEPWAYC